MSYRFDLEPALIAIGAIVNLFSARRFMRLVGELNRDQFADRSLSRQGVIVALFMAMLGIAMTIYLTFFPDATAARIAYHFRRHRDRQIGEDDGRFENTLRRQHKSALFGGSHHPTEGAEESGISVRSDRLLSYADRAFLHTQSLSHTRPGSSFL
jgi:hypothetical protein